MNMAGRDRTEPFSLKLYAGLTWALTPLFHLAKPLLALYGGFKNTVPERLGKFPQALDDLARNRGNKPLVWIHAVSVGEAAIAGPVMEAVRNRRPDALIAISVGTFTGREYVVRNFKPDALFFFPLDLPSPMNRLAVKLKADCFVDMEVELWPNCFRALKRCGSKMALANGRISDRAAKPPAIIRGLRRWLFECFDALFMRSQEDVERAIALGAPPDRTFLAGNLKFAAAGVPPTDEERDGVRAMLGLTGKRKLFVAGSTHPGEDEKIIEAWKQINDGALPDGMGPVCLVLAPRHLEQVEHVLSLAKQTGASCAKWTEVRDGKAHGDVMIVVVDTIGELKKLYGAADAAFVGGSLIPRGGHNVLEPVAVGVPTLHGPSMANFHDLVRALGEKGLLTEVADSNDLARAIKTIFIETDLSEYRARARDLIDRQLQAAGIIADWIAGVLNERCPGSRK
jgi:3-deoxy-D-manno-octulosonic-acid transferase